MFETPQEAYDYVLNKFDEIDDETLVFGLLSGAINHPIAVAATLDLLAERVAGDRMSAQIDTYLKSQTVFKVREPNDGDHEVWITRGEFNCQDCGAHGSVNGYPSNGEGAQQWHDFILSVED